jgi:hypothetical protein
MRLSISLLVLALIHLSSPAFAATKAYSSTPPTGAPGDRILGSVTQCPTIQTTPGVLEGFAFLEDDGAGSVSLEVILPETLYIDIGAVFGPNSFLFLDGATTLTNVPLGASVHVSAPGSGTDPGETAVWGIVSGWSATGGIFCKSSPVSVCSTTVPLSHGQTTPAVSPSSTYNLGTWIFDAVGDYEATTPYISVTANGGLANSQLLWRGTFQGAVLPALPLVGLGALALSLAVVGGRSLMGKK